MTVQNLARLQTIKAENRMALSRFNQNWCNMQVWSLWQNCFFAIYLLQYYFAFILRSFTLSTAVWIILWLQLL